MRHGPAGFGSWCTPGMGWDGRADVVGGVVVTGHVVGLVGARKRPVVVGVGCGRPGER